LQDLQLGESFIIFKYKLDFELEWLSLAFVDDHLQRWQKICEIDLLLEQVALSKIIVFVSGDHHSVVELDVVFRIKFKS